MVVKQTTKNLTILEIEFLKIFKTVSFKGCLVTVSDGENEQSFCIEGVGHSCDFSNYTQNDAVRLVELLHMNFKHIVDET